MLTEDGAFALFFRPHLRGFDISRVPTPVNLPSKTKKMLMPGGQPGVREGAGRRWNWLMHNTNWIVDPFTQVQSAKYMVKPKTKSISNLSAFSNFSKTERSIYNFLKIPAWNWSGSYLFCYGAWAQKESAKLQNIRACTDKTGLSSIKLVWLTQKAGWSADQRNLKMSAESLPLSRLI